MLRMVIADDEQLIRESISTLIDWKALGIEIVGCCKNGIEALDTILDEYPDIVMTDIKMPGLSGLELIEKIQGIDHNIEFIILSGYKEFEFAKQAMQFGVRDYLLKPMSEEQIIEAVKSAKQNCLKHHSMDNLIQEKEQSQYEMSLILRKQLVYDIFTSNQNLESVLQNYQDYFLTQQNNYQICYFSFLKEDYLIRFTEEWYTFIQSKGLTMAIDLLYVNNTAVAVMDYLGEQTSSEIENFTSKIYFPGQAVSILYREEIFDQLGPCMERLIQKLTRYSKILMIDSNLSIQEVYNYISSLHNLQQIAKQLMEFADKNDSNNAAILLDSFWEPINDIDMIRTYSASLLSNLFSYGKNQDYTLLGLFDNIYLETDIEQIKESLKKSIITILFPDYKESFTLSKKVKLCIEEYLSNPNLSLKWIAEHHLYMNVDYLSKQFIHETGEKFSTYLNRSRMEKAKELLSKCDATKIYIIAEQVGCGNNPRYFSQIFKKYTGMTPSKYIETIKTSAS